MEGPELSDHEFSEYPGHEHAPLITSTPVKSKRGKAEVELDQSEYEPPPKRLHGDACKKRQNVLQSCLQEKFVESTGKTTDRAEVMDYLKARV
jgi:hypothetical protein